MLLKRHLFRYIYIYRGEFFIHMMRLSVPMYIRWKVFEGDIQIVFGGEKRLFKWVACVTPDYTLDYARRSLVCARSMCLRWSGLFVNVFVVSASVWMFASKSLRSMAHFLCTKLDLANTIHWKEINLNAKRIFRRICGCSSRIKLYVLWVCVYVCIL